MRGMTDESLRIIAVFERQASISVDPAEVAGSDHALRVDAKGLIPRAGPQYTVQIALEGDSGDYRFPVPPEFNRQGWFVIRAPDLPVDIPYEKNATVSIIETGKRGEKLLARTPLRYRTLAGKLPQ